MVRILNGCNCGTCNGGTPAPEGHFGGSACLCRCHEKPGKPFNVPCEYCGGDDLDEQHEVFGCDKEPQPDVHTSPLKDGKPLSETGIIRKGWDWKQSAHEEELKLEHDACREDILTLFEKIDQQAGVIRELLTRASVVVDRVEHCTITNMGTMLERHAEDCEACELRKAIGRAKELENES